MEDYAVRTNYEETVVKNDISKSDLDIKPKKKKNIKLIKSRLIQISSIIIFFMLWQILSVANSNAQWFNPQFLPSPVDVVKTTISYIQEGTLFSQLLASTARVLGGFVLGAAVGVSLGILMSRSKILNDLINPVLNLIGPVPVYAFLPVFIIWFGIGEISKISLIAYATFLPILTYTMDGIKNVNSTWIRSAMSLGANENQIFRKVILKAALPNIFIGMRVSLALTFSALVVAEMMGANKGLGFIIVNARNWFKVSDIFMSITIIGLMYTLFNYILLAMEKTLFKWKKDGLQSAVEH